MISLKLNHQVVKAKDNQSILDIANANGVEIPTMCHLARGNSQNNPRSVCRICVVEVTGVKGLATACSTKATQDMEIFTHSDSVVKSRKVLMEFILAENEGDKTEENKVAENTVIKQLSDEIGVKSARFTLPKEASPVQQNTSEYFNIDPSLCIHCDRCIIACDSRQVITRSGFGHSVSTSFGDSELGIEASNCNYCGDCVSVCPAGAITLGPV